MNGLYLLFLRRREGARFWLWLLLLAFGAVSVPGYPSLPSYELLNATGNVVFVLACFLSAGLLVQQAPRLRLLGSSLAFLTFASIAVLFGLSTHTITTGTAVYGVIALLALDITLGGAQ